MPLIFDAISPTTKTQRRCRRNFRSSIALAILLDMLILALAIFILAFYWGTTYNWAIFLKSLHLVRLMLLFSAYWSEIEILNIIGASNSLKLLKILSYYTPLGLWIAIGWIDLVCFRVPLLLVDFMVLSLTGSFLSLRILLFLSLDIWLIAEFFFSNYLVYKRGVEHTLAVVYGL